MTLAPLKIKSSATSTLSASTDTCSGVWRDSGRAESALKARTLQKHRRSIAENVTIETVYRSSSFEQVPYHACCEGQAAFAICCSWGVWMSWLTDRSCQLELPATDRNHGPRRTTFSTNQARDSYAPYRLKPAIVIIQEKRPGSGSCASQSISMPPWTSRPKLRVFCPLTYLRNGKFET